MFFSLRISKNMKIKIGIIGYGDFGKLMEKYLIQDFKIEIFRRDDLKDIEQGDEKQIERLGNLDYLVFAVTLNGLEDVCNKISGKVSKETILVDVTSVKVQPLEIIKKYFPDFKILGTHPIFGPQSGKFGLENLPIVLSNISTPDDTYFKIKKYLKDDLKLKVIEKTPEQHDKEMAYIQGLSHLIGRALEAMDIQEYETATYSYKQLLKLRELVGTDSFELYKTIQNGNHYTKEVREEFVRTINTIEKSII